MQKNVITISRQVGSGGHSIAQKLAEHLGYTFYDKEIITRIAQETGLDTALVRDNGENLSESLFLDLAAGLIPFSRKEKIPFDTIRKHQEALIRQLAQEGNCIIVGRNADFILQNCPAAFHVFVHAPMPYRIRRVRGLHTRNVESDDQLRRELELKDRSRAAYYQYFTQRTWGMVNNYDLTLNSGLFTEHDCCRLILNALASKGDETHA